MTSRVQVWQSFSSNNSSDYRLVATFDDGTIAKRVAKELEAFMTAHAEEVDESGDIDNESQAQKDLAAKYNFKWGGDPLYWGDCELVGDEPEVAVAGSKLVMYHSYCGGLHEFESYLKAVGGKDLDSEDGAPTLAVWLTLPKGKKGGSAREALQAFFAQRDSEVEIPEWETDPPWGTAEDLPYADAEDALWYCDGEQAGFALPMRVRDFEDLETWFKSAGIKDYRLLIGEGEVLAKLKVLTSARRCPECQAPDPKYLPAESESLEEDQLLCSGCGGMFSLASIAQLAKADEKLDAYLSDKGVSRQCPECKGADLAVRSAKGRVESHKLLCLGCSAQVTVRQIVGASPARRVASGVLNNIALLSETIFIGARGGIIYRSTDGGETFEEVKRGKLQLFGLATHGEQLVYVAGSSGVILRSKNAGKTFQSIKNDASGYLFAITVADDGTVFIPGTGKIWRSVDGGDTFQGINTPVNSYILHVAQISAQSFYAVGHAGVILRSDDGGKKWTQLDSKVRKPICRVVVLSEKEAACVGDSGLIITTANGGQSWTKRKGSGASGDLEDCILGNDGRLYAISSGGDLLISADKGKKWQVQPSGGKTHLWGLSATPSGDLLMVGEGGMMVRRDDLDCPAGEGVVDAKGEASGAPAKGAVTASAKPGLVTVGKRFLFTGKLASMTRAEAKTKAQALGGEVKSSVTKDLDYLVVGDHGSPLFGEGAKGSKMVAAEKLIASGASLQIISETDFLTLSRREEGDEPAAPAPAKKVVKKVVKKKATKQAAAPSAGGARPTVGKSFLFTGKLASMTRAEAKAKVSELGGVAKSSVTQDLDYLVIGDHGSPLFGEGAKGSKMVAAEKLIAKGANLQIISETDFLKLERS